MLYLISNFIFFAGIAMAGGPNIDDNFDRSYPDQSRQFETISNQQQASGDDSTSTVCSKFDENPLLKEDCSGEDKAGTVCTKLIENPLLKEDCSGAPEALSHLRE